MAENISVYVNSRCFPEFDQDYHARRIVENMRPGSKYYVFLMNRAPDGDPGEQIAVLKDYWDEQGIKGLRLINKIKNFYNAKQATYNDAEDVGASDNDDEPDVTKEYENFLKFDSDYNLRPWDMLFYIRDSVRNLHARVQLFSSDTDNYAGKHLKLYDWTRTSDIDREYGYGANGLTESQVNRRKVKLNIYKNILESEPYNKIIDEMYIVILRPELDTYDMRRVDEMENIDEIIDNEADDY